MSGFGKSGALLLALIVPLFLQGCDPAFWERLTAIIAGPMCVLTSEESYLNSTQAQKNLLKCTEEVGGKVANDTQCCVAQTMLTAVTLADAECCTKKTIEGKLENITNATEKEIILELALDLCHNFTKNETDEFRELVHDTCTPLPKEEWKAAPTLAHEKALDVFYAVGESHIRKAKKMAEEAAKRIRYSTDRASSGPAGVAAVFLLAGALTACLAHGITAFVRRVRAQCEKESGYAQLLA
mmetsp:Transcript_108595/g.188601  ORF Transcript_108595/g.188601 Transcript_108595/m.188601 type:complete len:241 (-) Transcript_108595:93-815(-)